MKPLSTDGCFSRSVIGAAPARLSVPAFAATLETTASLFHVKCILRHNLYINTAICILTKSFHCSLYMHITFASISSSDIASHVFFYSIQGISTRPATIPSSFLLTLVPSLSQPHFASHVGKTSKPFNPHCHSFILSLELCA